jgi:hypothetical protein
MVYKDNRCLHMPFPCCAGEYFRYALGRQVGTFKYISCKSVHSVRPFKLHERRRRNSTRFLHIERALVS